MFLKILKYVFGSIALLLLLLAIFLRVRFGGGKFYPDLTTAPILPKSALEEVFAFDEPLGNIAVSKNNRIFFTVHPESRPDSNKVMEIVDGQAVPYPNRSFQQEEYITVLGMFIDTLNRLWIVDHGNHGFQPVRIMAFNLATDEVVYNHQLPKSVGERLSFCNDIQVSPDGRMVYIADVSFFGKNPAIIVLDTRTNQSRRLLEGHPSVTAQNWIPKNRIKAMKFFGGIVNLKPGVDGIVLDQAGEWLYYAAMAHDGLFKIRTADLHNEGLSQAALAEKVVRVGTKPLSDGLSIDTLDNIYITDVDHGAIARMTPQGSLSTLIQDQERIRWADGASFGGDGYLYFTDSAIPDQMLRSKKHMQESAPYSIYRVDPGVGGIPGR